MIKTVVGIVGSAGLVAAAAILIQVEPLSWQWWLLVSTGWLIFRFGILIGRR